MTRMDLFLTLLLMVSAISLVTVRFQTRELFVVSEHLKSQAHELDTQWRQLQLQRAELARNARIDALARPDERVVSVLRSHRPEPLRPFAWLQGSSTTNVFVPVLLGAGVVLSGLAWIVDRIARVTAVPTMERGLASRLTRLQPPSDGLLGESDHDPFQPR